MGGHCDYSPKILNTLTKLSVYRNVILPLILHGCEICRYTEAQSFGYQLRVFHNQVTRIFGLKMGRIAEPDQFITKCGRIRVTNGQGLKK
jgi:hypothetical protein